MQIATKEKLTANLIVTADNQGEDTVFISLSGSDGNLQYYVLDPLSSNLLYIEGDMSELTQAIATYDTKVIL
tara:strand:- start:19 stop:234 length:216 start_codon:yes stop_codon:yes gene_type:complete